LHLGDGGVYRADIEGDGAEVLDDGVIHGVLNDRQHAVETAKAVDDLVSVADLDDILQAVIVDDVLKAGRHHWGARQVGIGKAVLNDRGAIDQAEHVNTEADVKATGDKATTHIGQIGIADRIHVGEGIVVLEAHTRVVQGTGGGFVSDQETGRGHQGAQALARRPHQRRGDKAFVSWCDGHSNFPLT